MATTKKTNTEVDATSEDQFAGMEEAKLPYVKMGEVGDWFKGVLIANDREVPNQLSQKSEMQKVYEFKMIGGKFHNLDDEKKPIEPAIIIEAGSMWTFFGKPAIATQMRLAKLGQIIGVRFTEKKPAKVKGHNPTHVVKVYLGEMDATYQGEQAGDKPAL